MMGNKCFIGNYAFSFICNSLYLEVNYLFLKLKFGLDLYH